MRVAAAIITGGASEAARKGMPANTFQSQQQPQTQGANTGNQGVTGGPSANAVSAAELNAGYAAGAAAAQPPASAAPAGGNPSISPTGGGPSGQAQFSAPIPGAPPPDHPAYGLVQNLHAGGNWANNPLGQQIVAGIYS